MHAAPSICQFPEFSRISQWRRGFLENLRKTHKKQTSLIRTNLKIPIELEKAKKFPDEKQNYHKITTEHKQFVADAVLVAAILN